MTRGQAYPHSTNVLQEKSMEQARHPMTSRDRLSYQRMGNRPEFRLPNGARVAVWTIVNVENWQPEHAQPRTVLPPPMGVPLRPDIPNWCWHEYGMRCGFWYGPSSTWKTGSRNM